MKRILNGVSIYYEKNGEGKPIVLLHGNGEDHTIFDMLVDKLKSIYTVYTPDTRGHGNSGKADIFCYEDMAEDIAQLIQAENLKAPALYGFSDGGITGLLLAIKNPDLLSHLIISGANLDPMGLFMKWRLLFRLQYMMKKTQNMRLMLTEPHITPVQLHSIQIPTLVLAGQRDMIKTAHTRLIAHEIQESKLLILPKENHGSYVVHSDKLYPIISAFLEENV